MVPFVLTHILREPCTWQKRKPARQRKCPLEKFGSDGTVYNARPLRCFANNGVDLSYALKMDEDVRSCAQHLGGQPKKQERSNGVFVFDTSGLGNPIEYELIGGPYDGTTIRLGSSLSEMPPGIVTLASGEHETRLNGDTKYQLRQITEYDPSGNPSGEYLAYEHTTQEAK